MPKFNTPLIVLRIKQTVPTVNACRINKQPNLTVLRCYIAVSIIIMNDQLLLRPGTGAGYCDQFVCLSVCRRAYLWKRWTDLHEFLVQVPCRRGSVLFWRRCATLSTSGFMDDVTFGRNGPYGDAWKAELYSGVAIQERSLMSMNALLVYGDQSLD